jgi:hypothetical protein
MRHRSKSISVHEPVHELQRTIAGDARSGPPHATVAQQAGYVGVSVATTDQKVRGSSPFGRARPSLVLTSMNGQG